MEDSSEVTFKSSPAEDFVAQRQRSRNHIRVRAGTSGFSTSAHDVSMDNASPADFGAEPTSVSSGEVLDEALPLSSGVHLTVRQPDEATSVPGFISTTYTVTELATGTGLTFNTFTPTNTDTESGVPLVGITGTSTVQESRSSSASATSTPPASGSSPIPVIVGTTCGVLALVLLVALYIARRRYARLRRWKGPFMEKIVARRQRVSLVSGRTAPVQAREDLRDIDEATLCSSNMTIVVSSSLTKDMQDDPLLDPPLGRVSGNCCARPDRTPSADLTKAAGESELRTLGSPLVIPETSKADSSSKGDDEPSTPPPAYTIE